MNIYIHIYTSIHVNLCTYLVNSILDIFINIHPIIQVLQSEFLGINTEPLLRTPFLTSWKSYLLRLEKLKIYFINIKSLCNTFYNDITLYKYIIICDFVEFFLNSSTTHKHCLSLPPPSPLIVWSRSQVFLASASNNVHEVSKWSRAFRSSTQRRCHVLPCCDTSTSWSACQWTGR